MCNAARYWFLCILVLALAGSASAELVGYWKLDEGGGTTAVDSSGNGNDGTLEGGPVAVAGQIGQALEFDGSRVGIPASDTLTAEMFQGSFTFISWINPTRAGNTWQQIWRAMKEDSTSNDTLFLNNDGRLSWRGRVDAAWAGGMCETAAGVVLADQWTHVAVTGDETDFRIYVNGVLTQESSFQITDGTNATYYIGGDPGATGESYAGMADEVAVFNHALTEGEILKAMTGVAGAELASLLSPGDEATDVSRDTLLAWEPGEFAATHDVYLGTSFDDVNDARRDNPMDVLISQSQADTACDPGRLEFGQTYYWRVDEVNAAPDNTIFKGDVWSFTTELLAYPIEGIAATSNGDFEAEAGPENTINGSGLNADDQHSIDSDDMWVAYPAADGSLWIQYEFDAVYKLHQMLVWNYNVQFELLLGFGVQNATVEYSEDGINWTVLGDMDLAQATASADYAYNTTIDFGGVPVKYVKLTVNSAFGTRGQYGLSEVRFLSIPVQPDEPEPADGAADVSVAVALSWAAGREAAAHEVYLGTDPNALPLTETVAAAIYEPGALDLAATYYWQIVEVNEAEAISAWPGAVWSFSTEAYVVVDDFEGYNDEDNVIYESWIDGWVNGTGSTVGYLSEPFAETTTVHSGSQAMPLFYDNFDVATSEANLDLSQNWTTSGIQSLTLYFYGAGDNSSAQLYVLINGTRVDYDGSPDDLAKGVWMAWNIDLSTVGGNLSNVASLTIGIEGADASGLLFIDDIRLYPLTPEMIVPVQPDDANLIAHYAFEGDYSDAVGGHDGTAMGNTQITSDPVRGQVLAVDGNGDFVDIAHSATLNPGAVTASVWAYPDEGSSGYRSPVTSRDDSPQRGYIIYLADAGNWQFWIGNGTGWSTVVGPTALLDEWTHVTATYADSQMALYVNGCPVGETEGTISLNTEQPLRIGAGASESADGNYFFQGLIDDVRIYDRALSAEEAAGLTGRTEPLHVAF